MLLGDVATSSFWLDGYKFKKNLVWHYKVIIKQLFAVVDKVHLYKYEGG